MNISKPQELFDKYRTDQPIFNLIIENDMSFNDVNVYNRDIVIKNCVFKGQFNINSFNERLILEECTFENGVDILSSDFPIKLTIKGGSLSSLTTQENSNIEIIEIEGSVKKPMSNIQGIAIASSGSKLFFKYLKDVDSCNIDYKNALVVNDCDLYELLTSSSSLEINNSTINDCNFDFDDSNKLIISNLRTDFILLDGDISKIEISNSQLKDLRFNNFFVHNASFIRSTSLEGTFRLSYSIIEKLEFDNCDLSGISLEVLRTNVMAVYFNAIKWPNDPFVSIENKIRIKNLIKLFINKRFWIDRRLEYVDAQHIYRTLKQASENVNDKINYHKFKAFELKCHLVTLRYNGKEWADKISLWIGFFTNSFGRKWFRPIVIYIVLSYIIFVPISGYKFDLFHGNLDLFLNADFAKFLNPTHSLKEFNQTFVNINQTGTILLDYWCFLHLKTIPLFHFKSIPL